MLLQYDLWLFIQFYIHILKQKTSKYLQTVVQEKYCI